MGWQLANPWRFAQKFGFAILVIGLAGEWYSSTVIHSRDADRIVTLTVESSQLKHDNWLLKAEARAAEGKIAEDNRIAQQAAHDAAVLKVSVGNLNGIVAEQEQKNKVTIAELERSAASLDKARADALTAAEGTKRDLAAVQALLNAESALHTKIEKITGRTLTEAQISEIATHLGKHPIMGVLIIPVGFDLGTVSLAWQIEEIMDRAKAGNGNITPLPPYTVPNWRQSGIMAQPPLDA